MPRLSVGLYIYNGERFVGQAIQSILSQSFHDFELIISDNASTDATERICKEYAAKDPRVRYYRSEKNRGAAWNQNHVVELARGEYFKWQAYDDYCESSFLEKCLKCIEADPGIVLCYPQFVRVDDKEKRLGIKSSRILGGAEPHVRFRSLLYRRDSCEEIYGVLRTAVIRETAPIGAYSNSDDTFLAELILRGRFFEVPEPLFFYRIHSAQSTALYPTRNARMAWFDPSADTHITVPFLDLLAAYVSLVWRVPVPWPERMRCYASLAGWFWNFRDWLMEDLHAAGLSLLYGCLVPWFKCHAPWTRPIWHEIKRERENWRRTESTAAKAKRLRRARRDQWELGRDK